MTPEQLLQEHQAFKAALEAIKARAGRTYSDPESRWFYATANHALLGTTPPESE